MVIQKKETKIYNIYIHITNTPNIPNDKDYNMIVFA